jgi:nucleotide-binding universal stress UspA family protein
MVFLVPFDGSPRSEAALARAVEHAEALGEEVVAVSFVPTGDTHAERRRWIDPEEDFAVETASADLERKIEEATDDAERNYTDQSAQSDGRGVADRIRQVAVDVGASTVFVGTAGTDGEEPDQLSTPFGGVASDGPYDLHLVRRG